MKNVLSVDFDYWVPEDPMLDWGHQEKGIFLEMIWISRAASLIANDHDPKQISKIDEAPSPIDFAGFLVDEKGYALGENFAVAESHESAYHYFENEKNMHVIHVDAHHDMGYTLKKVNCDNWLQHLIDEGKVKKVSMIYPKWRLQKNMHWDMDMPDEVKSRIEDWKAKGIDISVKFGLNELPANVILNKVFVCRSGCWVPPWLDDDFADMCREIMYDIGQYQVYTFSNLEGFKRKFDWNVVKEHAEMQKKAFAEMNPMQIKVS